MQGRPSNTYSRRTIVGLGVGALGILTFDSTTAQAANAFTFLVLGTDYRGPEEPELSDVIMLSRVDLDAGTVRTLSIPRDLYVEIPGYGFGKINAAFSLAVKVDPDQRWDVGAASTVATITHNFGIGIDGTALTNMRVFPELVDAVGGVVVNNPYDLADGRFANFPAGEITLTGEEAIRFCRSRKMDGDGGRVMRQHLVLEAILVKLQQPTMLARIPDLVESLSGDVVRTTIRPDVQAQLLAALPFIEGDDLAFTNIEDQLWPDYTADGAWIYQGDWSSLPAYVDAWLTG